MFINPQSVIDRIDVVGKTVADFGSGTGEYVLEIAARQAGDGRVYALEVQKSLLDRLQTSAIKEEFENVLPVWTDLEHVGATKVPENSVDVALIINILFQLENKDSFGKEVKRLLKPGAKVVLVDWTDSHGGLGPQKHHVFDLAAAKKWCHDNDFNISASDTGGNHHYVIMADYQPNKTQG